MSYRSLPIGNLSNTNITFGSGIQSDASFSYVSVNCDPKVVLPRTSVTDPINPTRNMPKRYQGDLDIAGKIAVERDICNFEVANLKVTGTLILTGPAVFKSCVVIEEDGAICCPLTVINTEANTGTPAAQANRALCVEGTTRMRLNTGASTADGNPLLLLAANGLVNTNLASSTRLALDINVNSLTGQAVGHRILKTGSTMTANSRMLFVNGSAENGNDVITDFVTLSSVDGNTLTDSVGTGISAEITDPTTLVVDPIKVYKTAQWVNTRATNAIGREVTLLAPVGALFVDGGTVFRGLNGAASNTNAPGNHGHIHSAQTLPPRLTPDAELNAAEIAEYSTDTAGVIIIPANQLTGAGFLRVRFGTQYNSLPPPSRPVVVTQVSSKSPGLVNVTLQPENIPVGATITSTMSLWHGFQLALTIPGAPPTEEVFIHYHVIGLCDASL